MNGRSLSHPIIASQRNVKSLNKIYRQKMYANCVKWIEHADVKLFSTFKCTFSPINNPLE